MANRITAVFDTETQAEQAVNELRSRGYMDDHLAILMRHGGGAMTRGGMMEEADEETRRRHAEDEGKDTAERAGKGLLAGAGVGAIFGIAASLIPGVGPFITAGWLATTLGATAGGAAAGAIVGGTAGAVAGALARAGYAEDEARFLGDAVESGKVLVAVDNSDKIISDDEVRSIITSHGGRFAGGGMGQQRAA